jgi:hypothetical protein
MIASCRRFDGNAPAAALGWGAIAIEMESDREPSAGGRDRAGRYSAFDIVLDA